jgi:hypothetical protein
MFKRFVIALLAILNLASCGINSKEKKEATQAVLKSEKDTFYLGKTLYRVTDTSVAAFQNALKELSDTSEAFNLKEDKVLASRIGDSLCLRTRTGSKFLVNCDSSDENFVNYKYIGKIPGIDYVVIFVSYYEAYRYLIINLKSGKENFTCGMPSLSARKDKLACSSFDLAAAFVFNGIQMFRVGNDSLEQISERELTSWGADRIAWCGENALLIEQKSLDQEMRVMTHYIVIRPEPDHASNPN